MDITFHYPPELMSLLIDTIPLLNRSKKDVFLFFQGAGVSQSAMSMPLQQWKLDSDSVNKFEIVRHVLAELNKRGEKCLRERREILKRIVEFESFSSCWPSDQLKAKGLVAEIRKVVNVKDSFTRIAKEREMEREAHISQKQAEYDKKQKSIKEIEKVKDDLFSLFSMTDCHKRGKALESSMNSLFKANKVLVREAFTLTGEDGAGIVEQVDGVIELDGHLYFVEMKWWKEPIGVPEISQHLVRVYHRAEGRAIIISASDFSEAAISTCRDALHQKVIILCTLQEIVFLLEKHGDLLEFLKKKVNEAIVNRRPFVGIYQ